MHANTYYSPTFDRAIAISAHYGTVARVQYHSGSNRSAVNRMGIVPSEYYSNDDLKRGLEMVMAAADLKFGWEEGAAVFPLDTPLLDDIFERLAEKTSL